MIYIMKRILLKILMKLIGDNPFALEKVDAEVMQKWLFMSFKDSGFKQYYTLRKRYLQNELTIGMPRKEYWKRLGRLDELRALSQNIKKEADRMKKKLEKEELEKETIIDQTNLNS